MKNNLLKFIVAFFVLNAVFSVSANASTTSGTIDTTDKYAWGENVGWIDFGSTAGAVTVTDSAVTGYAYGENIGWISLGGSDTSPVVNDAEGNLSGYAWGENVGWINFTGVTINSSGVFSGYAYGENIGWINFTTDHPVTTDWRPASTRVSATPAPTPTPSHSTGSSVSSRVRSLIAQGNTVTAQQLVAQYPNTLSNCPTGLVCTPRIPATVGTPSGATPPAITPSTFSRSLTTGQKGGDVKTLQQYLNTKGYTISATGAGSPGNETTTFGGLTRSALARFQAAHNISPAVGFFGPITRAYIQNNQ